MRRRSHIFLLLAVIVAGCGSLAIAFTAASDSTSSHISPGRSTLSLQVCAIEDDAPSDVMGEESLNLTASYANLAHSGDLPSLIAVNSLSPYGDDSSQCGQSLISRHVRLQI